MDIILPVDIPIRGSGSTPIPESSMPIIVDDQGHRRHPMFKYLGRIDLDLTGLCNRQCSFCPRSLDADPPYPNINKQMSLETIEIVLKELRSINFSGWFELAGRGESTLHKKFEQIVDMITEQPRQWKVRLTTNGYRIEKWWHTIGPKLDSLLLNSYESYDQYVERQQKYTHLPNGSVVYHYYKQDGFTINEINKMPAYLEDGKQWRHAFNNRAGYFKEEDKAPATIMKGGKEVKISESPCWHPMRQIFIDFEGNYQMCCNDWLNQIKIGNIHERSLMDMYVNDPKLNRIRWHLMNRNRAGVLPCYKCDDIQGSTLGTQKQITKFKESPVYKRHFIPSATAGRTYDDKLKEGV